MTGGSPSLQDAQATYGVLTLTAKQKSNTFRSFVKKSGLELPPAPRKKIIQV